MGILYLVPYQCLGYIARTLILQRHDTPINYTLPLTVHTLFTTLISHCYKLALTFSNPFVVSCPPALPRYLWIHRKRWYTFYSSLKKRKPEINFLRSSPSTLCSNTRPQSSYLATRPLLAPLITHYEHFYYRSRPVLCALFIFVYPTDQRPDYLSVSVFSHLPLL
jgi:hypothetical protein